MSKAKALRALVPALAAMVLLAFAPTAQGDYEQVGNFAQSGNGEQLYFNTGTAINTTGAGGVEAGSIYVTSSNRVSRYNAKGEIKEVWGWGVIDSGPDATSGFERCRPANGDTCRRQTEPGGAFHKEDVGYFSGPQGVAVDQSTGYVYVLNSVWEIPNNEREHNLIEVFSADGSEVIARFGDAGPISETFEEGAEKIHGGFGFSGRGIAVDEDGRLYVADEGYPSQGSQAESRAMCFRPESPGDYAHYVYCGRSQDIKTAYPQSLALDDAGHLYVAEQAFVEELSLAEPSTPLCTYLTHGQLNAMTVNPATGEVFYFNGAGNDKSVHRLKPCDPAKGKFEEAQARIKASPANGAIRGLAFNPTLSWGPNRPPGVLYGADAEWHSTETPAYLGIGDIFAPAEVRSPTVLSESVSNTRTASTILHAEIDPNGFGTHYVFQYLTEAQYEANPPGDRFAGAMEAPVGGGEIDGSSIGEALVSISNLTPDTAYRFHIIATSECNGGGGATCVGEGEDFPFATYPLFPPGLPDHRAYEMVSPAQKHGAEVVPAEPLVSSCIRTEGTTECKPNPFGQVFPMQSSTDGEAVAYEGQPFNPFEGAVEYDSYVSRRTVSGWQTAALIPAQPPSSVKPVAYNAGLSQGLLALSSFSLALQPTSQPGSLTPLLSEAPPNRTSGQNTFTISYGGHSADFSRILFAANDTLTEATPFAPEPPDPGASKNDLYEWHDGQLTVVNVAPDNATVMAGASFASLSPDTNAVSDDGSRIYFEYEGSLYARIGGTETVRISQSQRANPDPVGFKPINFVSASPDGSRVLFSSSEELSDDADAGPISQTLSSKASGGSFTLSFEGQTTASIAVDASSNPQKPTSTEVREALEALSTIGAGEVSVAGNLQGGLEITRSGTMAASEALIEANGSGLTGGTLSLTAFRPGTALYEWHDGTLTDLTLPGRGGFKGLVGQSKDLSRFYFVDTEVLAGNEGAGLDSEGNPPLAEAGKNNLYFYEAGSPISFIAALASTDGSAGAANLNDWASAPGARTAEASPNGRFLAFASTVRLTGYGNVGPCGLVTNSENKIVPIPAPCVEAFLYDSATGQLTCASCNPTGEPPLGKTTLRRIEGAPESLPQPRYLTNEGRLYFDTQDSLGARDTNEGVEDVYEFAPQGTGAQGTCQREAGCAFLISAGTEAVDSNLIAVDETGKNVFFDTRDRLALKDKDELLDVYDAREGGGIAAESEIARAECQGENCQTPVTPPNDPTPGSSTFEGAGNVKETPVAKKHAKKKHKHAKKHKKAKKHSRTAKRNHGGAK